MRSVAAWRDVYFVTHLCFQENSLEKFAKIGNCSFIMDAYIKIHCTKVNAKALQGA